MKILQSTLKKPFIRSVLVLMSGTALAQVIAFAFSPLITRIYGPEAFGVYGTFMALVAIFSPIAALTYPISIVLPKRDSDANNLAKISLLSSIVFASIVAIFLLIGGENLLVFFNVGTIYPVIYLLPVIIVCAALLDINKKWLLRKKKFNHTSKVSVIQSSLLNLTKTIIGLYKPIGATLIIIYSFGVYLHGHLMSIGHNERIRFDMNKRSFLRMGVLAKRYKEFPFFRAPQQLMKDSSQSVPILALTFYFGPASAGFYVICAKVLGKASTLVATSFGDVFLPKIASIHNQGKSIFKVNIKAIITLIGIGLIPYLIIFMYGPTIFGKVFGSEWITAGEYAKWLTFYFFGIFISRPIIKTIDVLNLQAKYLIFEIISTVVRLGFFFFGIIYFNNEIVAIALFSISSLFMYTILIMQVLAFSKKLS